MTKDNCIVQIMNLLDEARKEDSPLKVIIEEFQEKIWNCNPDPTNEKIWNILRDLAYDLDYYEPNKSFRDEDPSFYEDDRARDEISKSIEKIKVSGLYPKL